MFRRWVIVLFTFTLILYVAAPVINNNFFYLFGSVFFLTGTLAIVNRFRSANLLTVNAAFPYRAEAGATFRIRVAITNRSWRPRFTSSLTARLPGTLSLAPASFIVSWLAGKQTVSAAAQLTPRQRGVWPVGEFTLEHFSYAGLLYRSLVLGSPEELIVHPQPLPDALAAALTGTVFDYSGSSLRPGRQGEEFYHLREYQAGDSLRRINWRATAKRQQLMVREDESPAYRQPLIILDTSGPDTPAAAEAFEFNVRIAATLARWFTASSGCGLACGPAQEPCIPTGTGDSHLLEMLDALAVVAYQPGSTAAAHAATLPAHALVISMPGGVLAGAVLSGATLISNDLFPSEQPTENGNGGAFYLSELGLGFDAFSHA